MKPHSILGILCLIASIALLALAYGPGSHWPALLPLPLALALWILARKRTSPWGAPVLLCVYLVLAVAAVLWGRPLIPLIFGTITALVAWDLADFEDARPGGNAPMDSDDSLERYRLQSLAITAAATLPFAAMALWLRVELPLGAIALLILLITGGLVSAVGALKNPRLSQEAGDGTRPNAEALQALLKMMSAHRKD